MTKLKRMGFSPKAGASVTVRSGFRDAGFDTAHEWIQAYRSLTEEIDLLRTYNKNDLEITAQRIGLIKEQMSRIEKIMEFVYPKIQGIDLTLNDIIEEDTAAKNKNEAPVAQKTTEELLKEIDD